MPLTQDNRILLQRLAWLRVILFVVFVGLGLKLWYLAVVQSAYYQELANRNQIRNVPLVAPRGAIYDREGRVLVDNTSAFHLFLYLDEMDDPEAVRDFLVSNLGVDAAYLDERIEAGRGYSKYQPVLIRENLSLEEIARVLARQSEFPELKTIEQPRRLYRYGDLAAHVFGFVGEVSRDELARPEFASNKPGDIVGKVGLERVYNRHLTGRDGGVKLLVNSAGRVLAELGKVQAVAGKELRLTIDLDLQVVAERELQNRPGAAFAFDPKTGDVLLLASRPAFDPNAFASRITGRQWRELLENPDNPLQNRVIQSTFAPGSIFKVVMLLAGLEQGVVDVDTAVYCNGGATLYGHFFRCWNAGGHGFVRAQEALQHSCNVYFYLLGQKLGIESIAAFSRRLGLGERTGIDLVGEVTGVVPSSEWKRRVSGQPWYAGETISVAIGQGALSVTPAQLARAVGIVATGLAPQLRLIDDGLPPVVRRVDLSPAHREVVRNGMWRAVNDAGTATAARVGGFEVCGKTGTVQTISREGYERLSEEERQRFEPNAWFVGFAPRQDPEIVVAVIVQRGGAGGRGAAPIAGKILDAFYRKRHGSAGGVTLAAR
jgi:penicillin-binding protein 2